MATVQERLRMNRELLDTWNTREKLCLASAVQCSGENWMSVSRNLKLVCGNHNESSNRPADFFSQKSCALQYAHLLENVETPKRKKRTSEGVGSPSTETSTDSVLRRLTEERIQDLKMQIRKDQEEYAKIYTELQKIQSPHMSEEMLREMWHEIEKEEEAQRIAEMKMENQLREREQKRLEMQRSWRLGGSVAVQPTINVKQQQPLQDTTSIVDMDVEEIIGVTKSMVPAQQAQQPTATSPLLSSLLKSPTATAPPTVSGNSSARTNAPTITTLLTSGSIPQTNQPAITLNSNLIPPEQAVQLLTRPISGPPIADTFNVGSAAAQNLLSPSQSAPTLSMLLERSKTSLSNPSNVSAASAGTTENTSATIKKEDTSMETESIKPDGAVVETTGDSDEPDPNEEQQLLEVFKNIGNIDELDIDVSAVIDEEDDFLKGVDDSPNTAEDAINFAGKLDVVENITNTEESEQKIDTTLSKQAQSECKVENIIKIETSDDSNDNIPLSAVATLEHKDRSLTTPTADTVDEKSSVEQSFLKDKVESATLKNIDNVKQEQETSIDTAAQKSELETKDVKNAHAELEEQQISDAPKDERTEIKFHKVENQQDDADIEQELKSVTEGDDEQMERFSTPTGDEKFSEQEPLKSASLKDEDNKSDAQADFDHDIDSSLSNAAPILDETNDHESHESNSNADGNIPTAPLPAPSIVSIADTDEDSCTTDNSLITKRDDKSSSTSLPGGKSNTEKPTSSSSQSRNAANKSTTADDSDSSSTNRASKRSLLSILSNLSSSKSAQSIQRALNEDQLKHNYQKICFRRLDLQSIKKSIENGSIRSAAELQRDLLLMAQNVCFLFPQNHSTFKAADIFKHEMQNIREFIFNSNEFETKSEKEAREIKQAAARQVRTGSRKSLRIA